MRRKINVKLLAIVLGSALIAAVGIHFLHAYQLGENAYRLLEHGDRALAAREFDKALGYYGQYLTFVPNDANTTQKYVQALDVRAESVSERVKLILMMEQVLRAKPAEHELRFRLVHNLITLDRVSEAMEHLRKLQPVWKDKAEVLHMLGWCQDAKKEYLKAVRSFEEAIKLEPTKIESWALLGEVLQDRLNQPEVAHKVMDEMVQANKGSHQAYLVRARYLRRRGDETAADADLQAAHALAPDRAEVILAVADAARVKGNWLEATRLLEDGLKQFPDQADLYKELVWVKIHAENRAEALAVAKTGLRQVPTSNELAILLIDLMIDQQRYAEADTKIEELVQAGLKPTLPNYLKARLRIAHEEWTEAIKLLEDVRQELGVNSEWNSRVNVLLGACFGQIGDAEQELQAYRRAVNDEPTWMTANVGMGAALLNIGRVEEASQTLEPLRTSRDLPRGFWILLSRTRLAQQLRRPEAERRWTDMEAALAEAEKAEPKSVAVPIARGELLAARRDFVGAKLLLEKTQEEYPDDLAVWCARADLSAWQGRHDEAEQTLEQAQSVIGDRLELRLAKCRLYVMRGNQDDRTKLARLGDKMPVAFSMEQSARLQRTLADAYYRLGDWGRTEKLMRDVARAVPRDLRSRSMLFDLALEKHQPALARGWLDEMRKIEGDAGLLWRYGAIAVQVQEAQGQRGQLEEARKKLQDLEQKHKMGPRLPLLAATIYELEGNQPQAIREYTRALDLGDVPPRRMARLLQLLIARREFAKAETELGRYEQKQPLTKDLTRLGADIAVGMRDKHYAKVAVARAESAVTKTPTDYRDGLWLARIYEGAGEYGLAEQRLSECLKEAGHTPTVWVAWMQHLTLTNQRSRAPQELERLQQELPLNRRPLTLARCLDALYQPIPAAQAYEEALHAQPNDFIVLAFAADYFRRADKTDEAQKLYQRLLAPARSAPGEFAVSARRQLAVLLAPQGQAGRQQALALLDANRKALGDTLADERVRLFVQSFVPATRQDALNRFQESLRVELPTPDERVLLARMLEAIDQVGPARNQLAEAVDETPAAHFLARFTHLLVRNFEFEEARRQFNRLESLEPDGERVRELRALLARATKEKSAAK
jgi:tetratricopeptide (TPR) repeat protein